MWPIFPNVDRNIWSAWPNCAFSKFWFHNLYTFTNTSTLTCMFVNIVHNRNVARYFPWVAQHAYLTIGLCSLSTARRNGAQGRRKIKCARSMHLQNENHECAPWNLPPHITKCLQTWMRICAPQTINYGNVTDSHFYFFVNAVGWRVSKQTGLMVSNSRSEKMYQDLCSQPTNRNLTLTVCHLDRFVSGLNCTDESFFSCT